MGDPIKPKQLTAKAPSVLAPLDTRKPMAFAYGFMLTFIACTLFILFNPFAYSSSSSSSSSSSPWLLRNIVNIKNPTFFSSNGSHLYSLFTHFFPNSSSGFSPNTHFPTSNLTQVVSPFMVNNTKSSVNYTNQGKNGEDFAKLGNMANSNHSLTSQLEGSTKISGTQNSNKVVVNGTLKNLHPESESSSIRGGDTVGRREKEGGELYESMLHCNIFDGKWVKNDSYPLYAPGSCPLIDEPFDCFLNGRPDNGYEKYRWQPNGCNIPRLNGTHMLELLRGKRLVYIGDSLNRNMWESLVCILRNSVEDKSKVFEASGRQEFRTEGSYSFIFKDYNCSIEFFRSPFLVQEWEVPDKNGSKKETLRLDLVERSSDRYKDADILIFNTGHWWTHEKTARGQGYYQEGSHVYGELKVIEAFRRAVTTWARWVDASVNPTKTQVFFRGYSASHFRGGRWNSGGKCDKETEPFKNDTFLLRYPKKMKVLENVIKLMKTPVFYLNITRLTDFRKDAHPAVYRAQHLPEEERLSPLRYQDCSHWCLPGVPDTWNELVYAQILIRHYQNSKATTRKEPSESKA